MVLPPVVPGYLLLLLLGRNGLLGQWLEQHFGIVVAFTWKGAVIAYRPEDRPQLVNSAIAGRITTWHVAEGQFVRRGTHQTGGNAHAQGREQKRKGCRKAQHPQRLPAGGGVGVQHLGLDDLG